MSPPLVYQPYHSVYNKTAEAAPHIIFQLNLSLFEAIHVPRVCTESFAITAYPAKRNPTAIHRVSASIFYLLCLMFLPHRSQIRPGSTNAWRVTLLLQVYL